MQLTDEEYRIFLSAMSREEEICKKVDKELCREPYETSLVDICKSIRQKVKMCQDIDRELFDRVKHPNDVRISVGVWNGSDHCTYTNPIFVGYHGYSSDLYDLVESLLKVEAVSNEDITYVARRSDR